MNINMPISESLTENDFGVMEKQPVIYSNKIFAKYYMFSNYSINIHINPMES